MTNNSKKPEETPSSSAGNAQGTGGLRFNQVGGDEPAQQILVPKMDAAVRRRTILFAGIAIFAILVLVLLIANPFGIRRMGGSGGSGGEFGPKYGQPE